MQATARIARDHHLILEALEVLRLIGDRMERDHHVDEDDVQALFGFLHDVAHPCVNPSCFDQVETLFNQLTQAHSDSVREEFVSLSLRYTNALVPVLVKSVLTDELARQHSSRLHQLESKYTSPHCI